MSAPALLVYGKRFGQHRACTDGGCGRRVDPNDCQFLRRQCPTQQPVTFLCERKHDGCCRCSRRDDIVFQRDNHAYVDGHPIQGGRRAASCFERRQASEYPLHGCAHPVHTLATMFFRRHIRWASQGLLRDESFTALQSLMSSQPSASASGIVTHRAGEVPRVNGLTVF